MITTGFYCDECRVKYVAHMCKGKLPCRHSFKAALQVWCQAFGRGGEHVCIGDDDVWLYALPKDRNTWYASAEARELWGVEVVVDTTKESDGLLVGQWLACRPDAFVRAFFKRWDSQKWTPTWVAFRDHPAAKRACAVMVRAK